MAASRTPQPRIVVVGLGPAGPEFTTKAAIAALEEADEVLVRTARHPAAEPLVRGGARPLDDAYERSGSFEETYQRIVEEVVGAALRGRAVVYAVPGSPFVLEETVSLLRRDGRVRVECIAGLSFVDLAWDRLGVDPFTSSVRFVDAQAFATTAAFERGPLLIAQCYSRALASEVKLAFDEPPPRAVVLHHLGLPDERVVDLDFSEIDRSVDLDHLSALYLPDAQPAVGAELARAVELVRTLRQRCPWDAEQTHASLVRHLLEESYEAIEAIGELTATEPGSPAAALAAEHLEEELGDVLVQVLFHATIGAEEGLFDLADVARHLHDKLVRRHPHVFSAEETRSAEAVLSAWEEQKRKEKGRESVMDGIPAALPALSLASKIEHKAAFLGLSLAEFPGPPLAELLARLGEGDDTVVGDLLLGIARTAAGEGVDPEEALRAAAGRLRAAISAAEAAAARDGRNLAELSGVGRRRYFGDGDSETGKTPGTTGTPPVR